ncbi:27815_t:CDS:2, partial [Dentiscutata erythropus]
QQRDLVRSGEYGALKFCDNVYEVIQLDDEHTRTPCQHVIVVYLLCLHTHILPSEIHQCWHVQHSVEVNRIPQLAANIFKKLPECHYDTLLDIIQNALNYIFKDSKIPKLQKI